jgi:uncharacterized protein
MVGRIYYIGMDVLLAQTNRAMSNSSSKPETDGKGRIFNRCKCSFVILLAFMLVASGIRAQKPLPELWGLHVHDEAKVLSQGTVDKLEAQLKAYEDSTSNQIAILIIQSLDGDPLEEYSLRVAEKWKLGQKEKDNGALLLISIDDHKMRIETGYGLEGALTDAMCSRIIRNELAPNFRRNDYDAGVVAGINAIVAAIGGEYSADDTDNSSIEELGWKERVLLGMFIFGILGVFTFIGLFVPGCAGWFLYAFLVPFYAAFPVVVFGPTGGMITLGTYMIGFPILKTILSKTPWGKTMATKVGSGNGRGKGWSSGSGWLGGGGGGWSSGGGGGFSGGGGSFGGGGSSGSW